MPLVKDIYGFLDTVAPFENKCDWDNCGLLVGDRDKAVNKIGFTLDLTHDTLKKAADEGVDLIITHHPVIFKPQSSFLKNNVAYEAAVKGISVISAHTCYDCAEEGVSYILAEILGLENITEVETEEQPSCVRIGSVAETDAENLAVLVAEKLGTTVRLSSAENTIKTVAVCGGSGGDFIYDAVKAGADAYVTGDLSHHHFLAARETGMTVIAAGHFETENPSVIPLMNKVSERFSDIKTIYLKQENPIKFIK